MRAPVTLRPHPQSACWNNPTLPEPDYGRRKARPRCRRTTVSLCLFSHLCSGLVFPIGARLDGSLVDPPSSRGRTLLRRSSHGWLFLATPRGANNPPKRTGSHSRRRRRSCLGHAVCRSCMGGRRPDKDACEQICRDPIACIKTKAKRSLDQHAQPRGWVSHRRKAQQQGCRCKVGSTTVMLTDNSNPLMQNRPARCHFL